MRVLLDASIPQRFTDAFPEHDITSVYDLGWQELLNGALLRLTEPDFDVLVTIDQSMPYQQNIAKFDLALIAIRLPNNRLKTIAAALQSAASFIATASPGAVHG